MRNPLVKLARLAATFGLIVAGFGVSAVSGSAAFDHAWTLTISQPCILPGSTQTLTVTTGAPTAVINVVVKYSNGITAQNVTLEKTAAGDVTYSWTVAANAPAGEALVLVTTVPRTQNTSLGRGVFTIGTTGQPCTPPSETGPFYGSWILPAAPTSLKKVCDSGVTGSATFRLTLFVPNNSASFTLPATWNLTAACNGQAVRFPAFGRDIVVTLHEADLPAGAAAAADTAVAMTPADVADPAGSPVTVTIHNARAAAVVVTPSPVVRLPQTGAGMQSEFAPGWLLLLVLSAVAASTVAWGVATFTRKRRA
jgi:hypothetical protein